jgi:hypothetical protein
MLLIPTPECTVRAAGNLLGSILAIPRYVEGCFGKCRESIQLGSPRMLTFIKSTGSSAVDAAKGM